MFDSVEANAQMIFPYIIASDRAEVFSEDYFQRHFPLTWAYLSKFKEMLLKRNINSKEAKWYQFGRTQSLTEFHDSPKLIWHVLSTEPTYVYDEKNLKFTGGGNGPYYSLISNSDYSPLYILGILSHPLIEAMVKAGASEFRGAYYSHGKQFIEDLPIRQIDFANAQERKQYNDIVKTVKQLIATRAKYNQTYIGAKKIVLERKFNYLNASLINQINLLYEITFDEVNTVLNDEMFLTDLNED